MTLDLGEKVVLWDRNLWIDLRVGARDILGDSLADSIRDSLRDGFGGSLRANLVDSLWDDHDNPVERAPLVQRRRTKPTTP